MQTTDRHSADYRTNLPTISLFIKTIAPYEATGLRGMVLAPPTRRDSPTGITADRTLQPPSILSANRLRHDRLGADSGMSDSGSACGEAAVATG